MGVIRLSVNFPDQQNIVIGGDVDETEIKNALQSQTTPEDFLRYAQIIYTNNSLQFIER